MTEDMRINRFLAAAGLGSRRKVEELVLNKRVTINGQLVKDLSARVDPDRDRVRVGARVVNIPRRVAYIILHKPVDCLTTSRDPGGRRTIYDLLGGAPSPLFPVGRLDRMSEGLLILTNDGPLAHRLAHPRFCVKRVYRLRISGEMGEETVRRFMRGVSIDDQVVQPEEVRIIHSSPRSTSMEIVLQEGRNREIRRICRELHLRVERLVRIRYGPVSLRKLPVGEWRHLTESEVDRLRKEVRLGTE